MGILSLPASGLVYVDTSIVIYSVETHAAYWPILKPLWEAARSQQLTLVASELIVLETLVGPFKKGDARLVSAYDQLFQSPDLRLVPVSQPILREAARLRAVVSSLRTPDALHAATAMLGACNAFLANDREFQRVPGLSALILDDVAAGR
jgi:predicted nucleic acid-binding protein